MKRQRRDGYWAEYHESCASKKDFAIDYIKDLVEKNPPPEPARKSGRGRPRVYSLAEMAIVCILMNLFNLSSRKTENVAEWWELDLGGRVPDHSTIARAHRDLDAEWLEKTVALTAEACLKQAGVDKHVSAADSTGSETDRYEDSVRLNKKTGKETVVRVKSYLKWHVFAAVGLQVILACAP